jgi:hypothetical protein
MKYIFDPSSKKFICPNCNQKRFVKLVDVPTNEYLNSIFGKCDRESSCGYLNIPKNELETLDNQIARLSVAKKKNSQSISYHSEVMLNATQKLYCNNNLYNYLSSVFSLQEIHSIFKKYKIGTSKTWQGSSIFWQIDNQNRIRSGKIILFDPRRCKRVKEPYNHITWVHSKLKIEDFNLQQCLFGLHLVKSNTTIAIVESEKTAIIMALFMPEYTWLATGSKQNFKENMLQYIKGNTIIAFPDKSEFHDWHKKASYFNSIGYKITVSDYVENMDCENGTDLADLYLTSKQNEPILALSPNELYVKKLAEINPEIFNLIETFDLLDSFDNPINVEKIKAYICDK